MMLRILLIFLFLVSNVSAATIAWDHDCANATGFYAYNDGKLEVSVDCPATQVDVLNPGEYVVTAFNDHGQSTPSNSVLVATYYYDDTRYEYSDGRILYQGENVNMGAATSDPSWTVKKYTYDANGYIIRIQIQENIAWDDRATGW